MPYYFLRNILFLLFAVSGFTGLIYESIWSHYLKLFLGHAAYAQALVLAIFMGGMALGAWIASRLSFKWTNLLLAYAIVEATIGFMGVVFHPVFQFVQEISFDTVIPALASPASVQLYKWGISTALILPQSMLLGMTFPLMSNGIIRMFPDTPGKSLAMLYFTNSLGAAIGVLFSGFFLIAAVGLPGTILFAGIINILLAIVVYQMTKEQAVPIGLETKVNHGSNIIVLLLVAAFITGMASFIYEIAWIRMLSMVLGASTHSFELMLSAFILGLALGGLFIRRYIDRLVNPVLTAGIIQIAMGICALATVPLYNHLFELMAFFMSALKPTDEGYRLFTFTSHFISLLVMLPATFCAGMTLPLFTKILLRDHGEQCIGQIYASNTLGGIAGVIFAIFVGMPLSGLKYTMISGAGLDVILGVILLRISMPFLNRAVILALSSCGLMFLAAIIFVDFDFRRMASTVYRTGKIVYDYDYDLLFEKHGKTSTVHVTGRSDGLLSITTNGKPDAAVNRLNNGLMGPDEPTMVYVAAVPLSINPKIKTVANIGIGSGLTTHALLAWPNIERVDTIEIESAMVEGAKLFRPRVDRTFLDPRSYIYIEDAKTYFSNHRKKYDLITSEPSNPWVSGVSSLFTDEFYRQIKKYLSTEGLFVQWLQAYEINLDLVLSVLKSLDNNFNHYALYAVNDGDLIIIAKNGSPISMPDSALFQVDEMKKELALIDAHNIQDIKTRFLANETLIRPLLNIYNPPANSDYFPLLDLNASRTRYKEENAFELARLRLDPVPIINMLIPEYDNSYPTEIARGTKFSTSKKIAEAGYIYQYLLYNRKINPDFNYQDYYFLSNIIKSCDEFSDSEYWTRSLIALANDTVSYLSPHELNELWKKIKQDCTQGMGEMQELWLDFYMALSRRNPQLIADKVILLLNKDDRTVLEKKKILMGSLLLALVKMHEYAAAAILWEQMTEGPFKNDKIPLGLKILFGMTVSGLSETQQKNITKAQLEN